MSKSLDRVEEKGARYIKLKKYLEIGEDIDNEEQIKYQFKAIREFE